MILPLLMAVADVAPAPPTPAARAEYSLPFAVRPWAPPTLVRFDSAHAANEGQRTTTSTLTAGAKVAADLGVYFRGAYTIHARETVNTAISNPAVFALYSPKLVERVRLPIFAAVVLPLGDGGGSEPDVHARTAMASAVYARQAMDNALFASNYTTFAAGIGLARVASSVTMQVEATVFQLFRSRGGALDTDPTRTNFTSGASIGYALLGFLNINAELHYQRWLSTPTPVVRDETARDQMTVGGGVRATFAIDETTIARPGIGYFQAIDAPMTSTAYRIVQADLPIVF